LLQGGSGAAATAEDHYRQALDWATGKARSLGTARRHEPCRLLRDQNRSAEAIALLVPIYNRFTAPTSARRVTSALEAARPGDMILADAAAYPW